MGKRHDEGRPLMVVPITGLDDKEYPFEFDITPEELHLEEFYDGPIRIDGHVSKVGSQLYVNGELDAVRIGECDRCLTKTRDDVEVDFAIYYRIAPTSEEDDIEDDEDDSDRIRTLHPEDHALVLDDEVRQTLRLQIPMKNLCRKDCKGLCPSCGAVLNEEECSCSGRPVDPRWAKLEGLFDKDTEADKN